MKIIKILMLSLLVLFTASALIFTSCGGSPGGDSDGDEDFTWDGDDFGLQDFYSDIDLTELSAGDDLYGLLFPGADSGDRADSPFSPAGANNSAVKFTFDNGIKIETVATWGAGMDLNYAYFGFKEGDIIKVSGKTEDANWFLGIGSGFNTKLGGWVSEADEGEFEFEHTLTAADVTAIKAGDPQAIRLGNKNNSGTAGDGKTIFIYEISIERTGETQGPGDPWVDPHGNNPVPTIDKTGESILPASYDGKITLAANQYGPGYQMQLKDAVLFGSAAIKKDTIYTLSIQFYSSRSLDTDLQFGLVDTSSSVGYWKSLSWDDDEDIKMASIEGVEKNKLYTVMIEFDTSIGGAAATSLADSCLVIQTEEVQSKINAAAVLTITRFNLIEGTYPDSNENCTCEDYLTCYDCIMGFCVGDCYDADDNTDGTCCLPEDVEAPFVPVTGITLTSADTGFVGVPLTLTATVEPANATNFEIVWSLKGETDDAEVKGDTLTATAEGTYTVIATVVNGKDETEDFTEEFEITIEDVAAVLTIDVGGTEQETEVTAFGGTVTYLDDGSGYTFEAEGSTDEGTFYALFQVDFGSKSFKDFGKLNVKYKTDGGDVAWKTLYLLASKDKLDASISADYSDYVISSLYYGSAPSATPAEHKFYFGGGVAVQDGPESAHYSTYRTTLADESKLYFGLYLHAKGSSSGNTTTITVSNIVFDEVEFEAVTSIADVPAIGEVSAEVDLTTVIVNPWYATNQDIVWSIEEADTTGVTDVSTGKFTATASGTITVKATIEDGEAEGTNFEKDFDIFIVPEGYTFKSVMSIEDGEDASIWSYNEFATAGGMKGKINSTTSAEILEYVGGEVQIVWERETASNNNGFGTFGGVSLNSGDEGTSGTFKIPIQELTTTVDDELDLNVWNDFHVTKIEVWGWAP